MAYSPREFVGWVLLSVLIITLIEHHIHKYHMHRRGWLRWLAPWLFENHQKIHHPAYRHDFEASDPTAHADVGVKIDYRHTFKVIGLPLLLLAYVRPLFSLAFATVTLIHHFLWNAIHEEMHMPQGRWFSRCWAYRVWREHHLRHHVYPKSNFNVIFIWGDYLLGTQFKH